jgi:uracil-DNA glycosylase family 4
LTDCYVTAGARCAPPDNKPTPAEFANCEPFLRRELAALARVRVILALGRLAHERFWAASDLGAVARRPAFSHGAEHPLPDGRTLIDSYHPSRQNTNTGRLTLAMWDAVFRAARVRTDAADR